MKMAKYAPMTAFTFVASRRRGTGREPFDDITVLTNSVKNAISETVQADCTNAG